MSTSISLERMPRKMEQAQFKFLEQAIFEAVLLRSGYGTGTLYSPNGIWSFYEPTRSPGSAISSDLPCRTSLNLSGLSNDIFSMRQASSWR